MRVALAILAAGRSIRFGRPKQLEPVGPSDEALFEYAVYDAIRAGCDRILFITRPEEASIYRTQAVARFGAGLGVEVVEQELTDLPDGFRPPPGRVAPWGTGHAVLTLRHHLDQPFLVVNADDFYGTRIIRRLVRRLIDGGTTGDPSHFLAGYQLDETPMSEAGGVSRAICDVDASLILRGIEEVRDVRPEGDRFVGVGEDGTPRSMKPEVLSSLNLWAFRPSIFEPLESRFRRFHGRMEDPLADELALSTAIGELVETGRIRVRVVPARERGFGMTYPEDLEAVRSGVVTAVAAGDYPTDLGAWFAEREGLPG